MIGSSIHNKPEAGICGAGRGYSMLCAALIAFLFAGALLIGLADAIGAQAAPADASFPSSARAEEDGAADAEATVRAATDENAERQAEAAKTSAERVYYVLPLSDGMQDEVYALCEVYDVPPELVFGIISADLMYGAPSGGNGGAAMDIPEYALSWCSGQLGIDGPLTFRENLECGVLLLSEYCHKYDDVNTVAMCYELSEEGAIREMESGRTSTAYSRLVAREASTLTRRPPKSA